MPTEYLDLDDVLGFYAELFSYSIQEAADHLLKPQLLESALVRPQQYAHYQGADLALQAAVLAHGIAEAQAFIDGNKRLAHVCWRTFLLMNGYTSTASQDEFFRWVLLYSTGTAPEEIAPLIRASLAPDPTSPIIG